jgi:ADP-ribose pyrophosphatase YjhB (NUDIX family)
MPKPTAVCVLARDRLGRVLALRGGKKWGGRSSLPGGKIHVEAGESPMAAAMREMLEETGLTARVVGSVLQQQAGPHWCEAFLMEPTGGELRPSPEGEPYWESPEALMCSGAFPEYYRELLKLDVQVEQLWRCIAAKTYAVPSEKALQEALARTLADCGIEAMREHSLSSKDRPDFWLASGIAVEVKTKGSFAEIARQLHRYASHPKVKGVVLVRSKLAMSQLPTHLAGKPLWDKKLVPLL